jgi:glutamine---fructose-6-phosphate transaminase (isomerizing)
MCGIVGYTGKRNAVKVLMDSLARLEYRGYDSAGIAVLEGDSINIRKKQGKLACLAEDLKQYPLRANCGIGHTRWATHGVPNDINAHPHSDCTGRFSIVHNGIIENYHDIKTRLQKAGCKFVSETDSEVIAHLIEKHYKKSLPDAVKAAIKQLKGSFAIAVVH